MVEKSQVRKQIEFRLDMLSHTRNTIFNEKVTGDLKELMISQERRLVEELTQLGADPKEIKDA